VRWRAAAASAAKRREEQEKRCAGEADSAVCVACAARRRRATMQAGAALCRSRYVPQHAVRVASMRYAVPGSRKARGARERSRVRRRQQAHMRGGLREQGSEAGSSGMQCARKRRHGAAGSGKECAEGQQSDMQRREAARQRQQRAAQAEAARVSRRLRVLLCGEDKARARAAHGRGERR